MLLGRPQQSEQGLNIVGKLPEIKFFPELLYVTQHWSQNILQCCINSSSLYWIFGDQPIHRLQCFKKLCNPLLFQLIEDRIRFLPDHEHIILAQMSLFCCLLCVKTRSCRSRIARVSIWIHLSTDFCELLLSFVLNGRRLFQNCFSAFYTCVVHPAIDLIDSTQIAGLRPLRANLTKRLINSLVLTQSFGNFGVQLVPKSYLHGVAKLEPAAEFVCQNLSVFIAMDCNCVHNSIPEVDIHIY